MRLAVEEDQKTGYRSSDGFSAEKAPALAACPVKKPVRGSLFCFLILFYNPV
jgi:hypothetical protein